MFFKLIIALILISNVFSLEKAVVKLKDSFGHKNHELAKLASIDTSFNLTLTIVTGSLNNTRLVANYYQTLDVGLIISDQTEMHLKLTGNVLIMAQIFKTTFVEYECNDSNSRFCYASNSEVSIPESLKSTIIGILGLEKVLKLEPNYMVMEK